VVGLGVGVGVGDGESRWGMAHDGSTDAVLGPSPKICKHVIYDDGAGPSKANPAPSVTDFTTEIVPGKPETAPGAARTHVMILAATHHHAPMPACFLLHADGRHMHQCSSRGDLVVVHVFAVAALLELGVLRSVRCPVKPNSSYIPHT
jgi:hypothetical protein